MTDKRQNSYQDRLIREAVCREMESIEAPSSDKVWEGIKAKMKEEKIFPDRKRPLWVRCSLAAAALLVITLGGYTFFSADYMAWQGFANRAADLLSEDSADEIVNYYDRGEFPRADDEFAGEIPDQELAPDPAFAPPDSPDAPSTALPPQTMGELRLCSSGERQMPGEERAIYDALYRNADLDLILAWTAAAEGLDVSLFPSLLYESGLINKAAVEVEPYNGDKGLWSFTVDGRTGMTWQHGEMLIALWVDSGFASLEDLEELALFTRE